jgi:hypothetical protein
LLVILSKPMFRSEVEGIWAIRGKRRAAFIKKSRDATIARLDRFRFKLTHYVSRGLLARVLLRKYTEMAERGAER